MTQRPRIKKNQPQRTQPVRHWPNIFRHPDQSNTTGKRCNTSKPMANTTDHMNSADDQQGDNFGALDPTKIFDTFSNLNGWSAAATAAGDIAEQGVRQGYNVIEDQIRRGREAAEQAANRCGADTGAGGKLFNDYRHYVDSLTGQLTGQAGTGNGSAELTTLVTRMAQSTAELSSACLQFSNSMLNNPQLLDSLAGLWQQGTNPAGTPPHTTNNQSQPDTATDNVQSSRHSGNHAAGLGIEVISTQPVKARLQLFPDCVFNELTSHGLHSANHKAAPLQQISFLTDGASGNIVQITIPDNQPGGLYSGVLLDADTNQPCGTITVDITRPASAVATAKKTTSKAAGKKKRNSSH